AASDATTIGSVKARGPVPGLNARHTHPSRATGPFFIYDTESFPHEPRRAPLLVPGAKDLDDFKHANLSVLDIRNQAKLAGREILPASPAQAPLSQIISACNEYLENSMYAPDQYYFGLIELRSSIHKCVKDIAATDAKVTALEPGISAFTRASQQPVAPPSL
ncbi:hypothetical protein AB4089_15020, partial [Arthrobacter sp. 2MCAF15]|uniref:hypothetical protein n=1 Tax=Arthrobacter sp. 2MCAF15 TaxID=3232984 RepID=UPI003F908033